MIYQKIIYKNNKYDTIAENRPLNLLNIVFNTRGYLVNYG